MNNNLNEFIANFVEGIECHLWETDSTILYVDEPLADFLNIEVDDIQDSVLENTIKSMISILNNKKYDTYKYSYNEISVSKIEGVEY